MIAKSGTVCYNRNMSDWNVLQNLHTHTVYDDGENTPEEIVKVTDSYTGQYLKRMIEM